MWSVSAFRDASGGDSVATIGRRSHRGTSRAAVQDDIVASREWSTDPKVEVASAIARAQADLEQAVAQLQRLPALDTHSIALGVHALRSFLTVAGAVVDLLVPVLRDHPDRQVGIWLDGLAHATDLMGHTISDLMNRSVRVPTTLRLDDVDVATLVTRACAYHARAAGQKGVVMRVAVADRLPSIRSDRVLMAVAFDSVLANAVQRSSADTVVTVALRAAPDGIACVVRDDGPVLSAEARERLFVAGVPSDLAPGGYGLVLAKRFVDQLGGTITCESALGAGTSITIGLPSLSAPP